MPILTPEQVMKDAPPVPGFADAAYAARLADELQCDLNRSIRELGDAIAWTPRYAVYDSIIKLIAEAFAAAGWEVEPAMKHEYTMYVEPEAAKVKTYFGLVIRAPKAPATDTETA